MCSEKMSWSVSMSFDPLERPSVQSLAIFTAVLVVFACVIAGGMVYNGAHIAL
jgi:hypothetical protein